LDTAVISLQEKTGPVLLIKEGQALSILIKASVSLNEGQFIDAKMGGDFADFPIRDADEPRPSTTGRASLAEISGRHC